ncbi:protein FAR1-RELATED SEQUENCE 4-like [Rhododendron vialii]|uniref:protein FAR1-RELATED SEQUENCE 4-like n=1 Tax=Rhododendron vialii TaxID=182163 RepID=UPI00265EA4D7|nr:protein FAR1-RELATED SEQUENCE 4-like [Rhododendron vialii]
MMLSESVPLTLPPNKECGEQEKVWSGDSEHEEEVWCGPSSKDCDEIETIEETENCEHKAEEPKVGMTFDTSEDAYLYYLKYAKENGFAIAKRSSRKGRDGNVRHVWFECCRAGKARVRTSNPVKPRPQTKIECPAHNNVVIHPDGKWRLSHVVLEHNHEQSPAKARYFKCNRVLDEHVKRKLELNDQAGIRVYKTYDSLQIEAGGPDKLPFLKNDCRNHLDKVRRL